MSIKQRVLIGLILGFTFLSYAATAEINSETICAHNILAEFEVAKKGDTILLPVKFKGKEYSFILDTGASVTMFDASHKDKLGIVKETARLETAKGLMSVQLFDAPEALIGPLNLRDCGQVTCIDHSMFGLILGREVRGTIGMNFLKKYVVQIDFDKGKLYFIQPTDSPGPGWGEELAISYDSLGRPQVEGNLFNSITVDFQVDTGLNASVDLEAKIFRDVLKDRVMKTSEVLAYTPSGTMREISFRATDLSVGSLKYENLIFNSANGSLLGLGFLSRHIVTFDFPNSKIYFKKGGNFEKIDEADMSGLHLLRVPNGVLVYSIDKDSPAEKAGIKANDIILRVGNKDASKYDMQELRRFLKSGDRQEVTMTIKHGTDVREVSFLLKKKI